jgi:hypothetical protein
MYNAGSPVLAITNLANGNNYDESSAFSPTTISAGANSALILYSASAVSASMYRVIGYIDVLEATAGTWVSAPTNVNSIGGQSSTSLSGFGIGQSWQNVARAVNTTYYNTTGKPIFVNYTITSTSGGAYSYLTVNGVTACDSTTGYAAGNYMNVSAIIPVNASYLVNTSGAGGVIVLASELR